MRLPTVRCIMSDWKTNGDDSVSDSQYVVSREDPDSIVITVLTGQHPRPRVSDFPGELGVWVSSV